MSKAYPKYKLSGVEWLGDVPEHWGVKKLKYVSNTNTGFAFSSDDYTDEGIPLIRIGDILQDGNVDIANAKKLPEEYLRTYRFVAVNKNDMLMAMTGATIGKAGRYQFHEKGLLNQRVCKFVPFKIFADYFWFILKSEQYAEHIKLTGFGGAQPNISDVQLLDFHFALPPLPEQQDIAAFLDRETGRIDTFIAKKERLLELLAEQRTALISRAVTKGLDASVKMKPSGVEWLGDVPEHWEVKRLKYQVSINDETLPETTDPDYEMLYVDISSVDPTLGIVQKDGLIFENAPSRARRIVRDGDTIVSTVRTYLRAIAPVIEPEGNLIVSTGFAVIRPRKIDKAYLSATIRAPYFIEEVVSRSVGVSYPAINASEIGFITVPLPPLPEQQAIAAFLDRETTKIDALSVKVSTVIERLKEYRTALISSAVTGKIDVREAV